MNMKAKIAEEKRKLARGGGLRSAAQGALLGFGDELEAAVRNPGLMFGLDSSRQEYDQDVANIRGSIDAFRELNPKTALAAEIGGAVVPSLAAMLFPALAPAAGARNIGLLGRMGRGALTGATEAGVYSMGTQEGGLLNRNPLNMETATGGAIGFALPPVLQGVGRAVNRMRNPMTKAQRAMTNILGRDNTTVTDMVSQRNLDKPQVAADLSGANAQSRVGALEGMPGPQRDTIRTGLRDRQLGQAERAIRDIEETTGAILTDTNRALEDLSQARKNNAQPLYEKAYEAGQVIDDPELLALQADEGFQAAYNKGKELYEIENRTRRLRGAEPLPPLPEVDATLNLRGLDQAYRGLRAQADKAFSDAEYNTGRALKDEANALRDKLDEMFPEYREARAVYKSDSEMIEALESGRDFMSPAKTNSRTIREEIADLDEGQLEAYRMGAVDAIRQSIYRSAKDGTNIQNRFFGTKEMRDRLRLLYPDGDAGQAQYDQMLNRLSQETQMQDTLRATYGSRTTPMAQEVGEQLADEGAIDFSRFNPRQGLKANLADNTYRALEARARGAGSPATRQATAELLMDPVAVPASNLATREIMPVASPAMQELRSNTRESLRQAAQLRGLLNRTNIPLTGFSGLLGGMGMNERR